MDYYRNIGGPKGCDLPAHRKFPKLSRTFCKWLPSYCPSSERPKRTEVRSCVQVFLYFSRSVAFLEFVLSQIIKVSVDQPWTVRARTGSFLSRLFSCSHLLSDHPSNRESSTMRNIRLLVHSTLIRSLWTTKYMTVYCTRKASCEATSEESRRKSSRMWWSITKVVHPLQWSVLDATADDELVNASHRSSTRLRMSTHMLHFFRRHMLLVQLYTRYIFPFALTHLHSCEHILF